MYGFVVTDGQVVVDWSSIEDRLGFMPRAHDAVQAVEGARYREPSAKRLASIESLRALSGYEVMSEDRVSCDIFLMGQGSCPVSGGVRVCGEPSLPSRRLWPRVLGRRLPFLMQFDFRGSLDVLSFGLPGDILCVFGKAAWLIGACEKLRFVWVRATEGLSCEPRKVIDRRRLPLFGMRHRSWDYEGAWCDEVERYASAYERLWFTKIGGLPPVEFEDMDRLFLCQYVQTRLLNATSSLTGVGAEECPDVWRFEEMGDMGGTCFFAEEGKVFARTLSS